MPEDKDNNSAIDDRFKNGRGAYASGSDDYDQESLNDSSNGDPSDEEKKLAETTGSSGSGWADKTNKSSADKISPKGGAMALLSGLSGKKKAGLIGGFGGGFPPLFTGDIIRLTGAKCYINK